MPLATQPIASAPIDDTTATTISYNEIGNGGTLASGVAKYNVVLSAIKTGGVKVSGIAKYNKVLYVVSVGGIRASGVAKYNVVLSAIKTGGINVGGTSLTGTSGNLIGNALNEFALNETVLN